MAKPIKIDTSGFGPPPGPTQQNSPLGVGLNYKAPTFEPVPGVGPDGPLSPTGEPFKVTDFNTAPSSVQYMPHDEWKIPLSNPGGIPALKEQMLQAGLLTAKTFGNPGVWDNNSAAAYVQVLAFANAYGLTASDAMSYKVANPTYQATRVVSQHPSQATNPADLHAALTNESQNLIGHDPTQQQLAQFTQGYLAEEEQARQQLAAASGKSVTGPPSPTAGADQYIDTHALADKVAYGAAVKQQAFFNMLRSPV